MDERTSWVDECLERAGRRRTGELTEFRERAWASVYSAPTDDGTVWLKTCPPDNAFEVALYDVLAEVVPERVLVPLGADADRGWLLLPDGGTSEGDRVGAEGSTDVLVEAMPVYAELQRRLAPHVDRMLAAGVADMRPEALPAQFDRAIELVAPYVDAHPEEREAFDRVRGLRPEYRSWSAELADAQRPATLDHNDLHAWNVLAGGRFYDWGDSVIAHPFACLLTPLTETPDEDADRIRNAYLAAWGDPVALREEAELATRVANVTRAHVWSRAIAADPLHHEHADAPLYYLKRLLTHAP